jgi:hypothetical protein
LFSDGHVKSISQSINRITWQALSTRNGREVIDDSSY